MGFSLAAAGGHHAVVASALWELSTLRHAGSAVVLPGFWSIGSAVVVHNLGLVALQQLGSSCIRD